MSKIESVRQEVLHHLEDIALAMKYRECALGSNQRVVEGIDYSINRLFDDIARCLSRVKQVANLNTNPRLRLITTLTTIMALTHLNDETRRDEVG